MQLGKCWVMPAVDAWARCATPKASNTNRSIESIQQAVQQAETDSGLKIDTVYVGIAGQHIRSLQHSDYITRANSEEAMEGLEPMRDRIFPGSMAMQK